ncbi:MAG: class I SAM-dependent methyltransferase [Actinobacteria bacterium]|nr:class I SAM-dependent methyltransferase [Actinomycetota bacterium]
MKRYSLAVLKSLELERLSRVFSWVPPAQSTTYASHGSSRSPHRTTSSAFEGETSRHIDEMASTSWWYSTRNTILWQQTKSVLQEAALWDIGGGSGIVARYLMSKGVELVLVEPSAGGAVIAHRNDVPALCATLEELQLPDGCLPTVGLFDVLEHLENRQQTLSEIHRVLAPGGYLLLTLPALASLWSGFDDVAGHYVRYNKRSIRDELEGHGFEIRRMGYFFALTILPLFVIRALPYRLGVRKLLAEDETLSASGGFVGKIASVLEQWLAMRTPLGTSLLVMARKRVA